MQVPSDLKKNNYLHMKCKTIFFLLIAIELFSSLSIFAVPVDPRPLKYTQPDGSVITIRFYGDEVISWAETMDGFKLINNGKNGYEYATLSTKQYWRSSTIRCYCT